MPTLTANQTLNEIQNLLDALADSEVALLTNKVVETWLPAHGYLRVTWANNLTTPGFLFRSRTPTMDEYIGWVENNSYSALLFDGAIIQVSFDFSGSALVGHRLHYFPCPFDLDAALVRREPFREVLELYAGGSNLDEIRLRTPIRFDFRWDDEAATGGHPASHMTFQWSHARVPVLAPLSLGHFVRFIFKNFYPNLWRLHRYLREWPIQSFDPTIELEDSREIHISLSIRQGERR